METPDAADPPDGAAEPPRPKRGHAGLRACGLAARAAVLLAVLVVGLVSAGVWRLQQGPFEIDALAEQVSQALERQFEGYDVNVDHSHLEWADGKPILAVTGVTIRDAAGNLVVAAPQADIGFDPLSLATFRLVPRHISFVGLAIALTIDPDGNVSISASGVPDGEVEEKKTPVQTTDVSFGPGALLDALSRPEGPMRVLEQAGVRDGRLRVNDRRRGHSVLYDGLSLAYDRPSPEEGRLALSARSPTGAWSMSATISGKPGETRSVRLATTDLAVSDLIGIAEPGAIPIATEMPISGSLTLSVGPDNTVTNLDGWISGGSAMVLFDDPDAEPFFVDSIRGEFGWDAAARAALVRRLELVAGETSFNLSGRISPPSAASGRWSYRLDGNGSTLAGESPGDPTVAIETLSVEGHMPIGLSAIHIDRLEASGPQFGIRLSGAIGRSAEIDGSTWDIEATKVPARTALSFWPYAVAPDVRNYFKDALEGGTAEALSIRIRLGWDDFVASLQKKPVPDAGLAIDVVGTRMALRPEAGLPTITNMDGTLRITGRTAAFTFTSGTVGPPGEKTPLTLSNGSFEIRDTSQRPATGQLRFDVAGDVGAVLRVLRSETLKPYAPLKTDPGPVKGQIDAKVAVTLPMMAVADPRDVTVQVTGTASGIAADGLFGREKMEGGAFSFAQDRTGLQLKGEARLTGSPAAIEVRQASNGPVELAVALTLDDAARARRGIKVPQLAGPVDLKLAVKDAGSPKPQPRIEADLTKATLTDALPGWSKPAGRPAKLGFRLDVAEDGAATLDDLVFDGGGGVTARGQVKVGADGTLSSARLSSLKLAPGDDMKVDVERHGAVPRVTVRAASIDARPLLKSLMAPGAPSGGKGLGDVDLDVKSNSIAGLNNETASAVDARFTLRNGEFREFRLAGRFGQAPISGQMARMESGNLGIVVETAGAGDFLRFFDIYRRMNGGAMLLQLDGAGAVMSGSMVINRFVLVNEPALARSAPPGEASQPNSVEFSRMKAGFSVGGGRLAIRDGTLSGTAVGGTLEGQMDFSRDRIEMSGTFVPAYGLNNMLNQVPVVGTILGGGQNEGIFAVNFRISGKASQPTLSVNPLSAVAPGILRKFFPTFSPNETSSTQGEAISAPPPVAAPGVPVPSAQPARSGPKRP